MKKAMLETSKKQDGSSRKAAHSGSGSSAVDRCHIRPDNCSQMQWDELMQVVHRSGHPVRLSSSAFAFFLGAGPPARRVAHDRWIRESEGPILELTRVRSENGVTYIARLLDAFEFSDHAGDSTPG